MSGFARWSPLPSPPNSVSSYARYASSAYEYTPTTDTSSRSKCSLPPTSSNQFLVSMSKTTLSISLIIPRFFLLHKRESDKAPDDHTNRIAGERDKLVPHHA